MSDLLEGWAYDLDIEVDGIHFAEHTYVKAPGKGTYFNCWGGHHDPNHPSRKLTSGQGNYAVANCYRGPTVKGHQDTAHLVYGVTGVCHQTANRFLYSASGYLPKNWVWVWKAKGYAASHALWGDYGTDWMTFKTQEYGGCWGKYGGVFQPENEASDQESGKGAGLSAFYHEIERGEREVSPQELVAESFALLVQEQLGAEFEPDKLNELQRDLLQAKDKIVGSDVKGEAFAHELNGQILEFLERSARHLGPVNYESLFGYPPGEKFLLVNPEVAAVTRT